MQVSFFDGNEEFYFNKPIRLIEFFAGYGSQALALKELGVNFQHWRICEWAVKSIQAYKDNHFSDDTKDYSQNFTSDYIFNVLAEWGISQNYNEPLTLEQIKRLGEKECRKIYNNILATRNLVNISRVKGKDLQIEDTDKYDYVLTYSFPCQDLSKAGKGKGMAKDSGTRSGLLWEVDRILDECAELGALPQILLMENVPDVIGAKNLPHFRDWRDKLESMGYKCYWQVLNSKDYGIPQNRERCFMISILGDYYFSFPKEIQLPHKLIDILETNVDEKYYLSDKMKKYITSEHNTYKVNTNSLVVNREIGCTINTRVGQTRADCSDYICNDLPENFNLKKLIDKLQQNEEPIACKLRCDECIRTFKDNIMGTLRTIDGCGDKHIIEPTLKEQLCDRLVESGLLKVGTFINHSYTNGLNGKNPNSRQTLEDYIENEDGICNTLTTRPDVLGVAVEDLTTKNKRLASMVDKIDPTKCQAIDMYNQSVHDEMHTIKTNVDRANMTAITQNLRIRKLTPRECFRLMAVRDENFEKIAKNQSNASLYHLAGDSIVVAVLVVILGQFVVGFNFDQYIEKFYNQIKEKESGNK
jgi:DNA (cytosine-5)-methyltransferase 1